MKFGVLLFAALALCFTGLGFLPGHTLAPLDLPLDSGAWKDDPTVRIRVSNSLHSDVIVAFIPWDAECRRQLASGEIPWRNPWAGAGAPLFANPQTALFSPFTWPRLLFGLDGLAISAFLRILAAALCMMWLARELGIPTSQAVVSGLVYAASGFVVVWLHFPAINVAAFLPGLLAAALRLAEGRNRTNLALVIALAALCSAGGHPETLFVGVVFGGAFLIWDVWTRGRGLQPILPPSLAAFLGFLLLSLQTLPFLLIVRDSFEATARTVIDHGFRFWSIPSQVLPGLLGSPLAGELDLSALVGAENIHYRAGAYVGALVLLAIIIACRQLAPALRRGLIVGTVALALSWYPPGVWQALRLLPLFQVTAFEYLAFPFVLFSSLAAGPALAVLASRRRPRLGAALVAVGFLVMVAGSLPSLETARPLLTKTARQGIEALRERGHLTQAPEVYEARLGYYLDAAGTTTLRRVALPGLLLGLAGLALSLRLRRRDLVLGGLAMAELLGFGLGFNPTVAMDDLPPAPDAIRTVQRLDPEGRFLIAAPQSLFPANLGTLYGVRDATSYDVLTSAARAEELARAGFDPHARSFRTTLTGEEVRALGSLGVRFLLSRDDVPGAHRVSIKPRPAVGAYEIPGAVSAPVSAGEPPPGFWAGLLISVGAALASGLWLRRLPRA